MTNDLIINKTLFGVSAVIFDESDRVLMLLRSGEGESYKSGWEFVKGGLKEGESYLDAAIREIREESHLNDIEFVAELEKKYTVNVSYRNKNYDWVEKKSLVFILQRGDVSLVIEHSEYKWMNLSQAIDVCWVEYGAEIIKDAYDALKKWQSANKE